jgi:hypothetical protein
LKANHLNFHEGRSTVFAATFANDYQENITNSVEIKDFKFEVFEGLLKFIYSGKVDDLDKHAADLFRAAEKVMFLLLFTICKRSNDSF